jgi:Amt family ammonium transporter
MKLRFNSLPSIPKVAAVGALAMLALSSGFAQEAAALAEAATPEPYESYEKFAETSGFTLFTVNNLWILVSAMFVFLMHLGFASVESGLARSKNTVNILFKNMIVVCIGLLSYALWGFNAMYPGEFNGYFATGSWFGVDNNDVSMMTDSYGDYTLWTDFIFQAMFAATAATIVSGAVAERVKFGSFLVYTVLLVTFVYPMTGSWKWGGGWLDQKGFYDFAGSTLVHGFGGFAALAAVMVLGPRSGKYVNGKIRPILGHNMPLAMIGVMLLWLGWYGFNGGSVLSADPRGVSYVFVTTTLAAAAGAVAATFTSWIVVKKPDFSMGLNGILAGLVGITAGADTVGMASSIVIGAIAGAIVVVSILFFDKVKIDDPVGAISVHGVCGIWGTLAVGIFSTNEEHTFGVQLLGCLAVIIVAFVASLVISLAIKAVMGIRVSLEEENEGLDIGEHGNEAYPNFMTVQK